MPTEMPIYLRDIRCLPVGTRHSQEHYTDWLAVALERRYVDEPGKGSRAIALYRRLLRGSTIDSRETCVPDYGCMDSTTWRLFSEAAGKPWYEPCLGRRMDHFQAVTRALAAHAFQADEAPPATIIQVTCTGYEAPTAAQRLVAMRGWGRDTRLLHLGHMGCFAAVPATRLAASLAREGGTASVFHTELCSLHLSLDTTAMDQVVVHHLFADGAARYDLSLEPGLAPRFRLLDTFEITLPDSAEAMCWTLTSTGFRMTLARDVPRLVAEALPGVVAEALTRQGLYRANIARWAIHPGGSRIIDGVAACLELDDPKLTSHSREVFRTRGNMSSATLPHIWSALLDDPAVAAGELVVSLAFGPGLTITGNILRKEV